MNPRRPLNILFIFADQMHGFAMGCMGDRQIHTPNLDRLAEEGVLFENTYSNAPVCTPFRGTLFTGRYASQTRIKNNESPVPVSERTLAGCLNEVGYRTSYVGKWHLGDKGNVWVKPELRAGFSDFLGYQCYNDFLDGVWFFDEDGSRVERPGHRTDVTTDLAIERLERVAEDRFAMFVSYQTPHYPLQPSPEYEAMYEGVHIERRPNAVDIDPYTPTFSPRSPQPKELDPVYQKYGGSLDTYLRLYYAMITQLDANVGRLLSALDRLGLRESTAVIFTSDHGDMQGSHGLRNKGVHWEESTRIPLIVRAPGGQSGMRVPTPVSGIDFFPTCLDFAGAPLEPSAEGASLAPGVLGEDDLPERPVFAEERGWCMVRHGDYKYVARTPDLEPLHLFDLESDPYEMKDLINREEHGSAAARLRAELLMWWEHVRVQRDAVG